MIRHQFPHRVRYADVDQMGYVYYGHYARFFEIGRTELVRDLGVPYSGLEAQGIMMPVLELHVEYKKAARYDDLITIQTELREQPSLRIRFDHAVRNSAGELCVTGHAVLVFVQAGSMRPCRPPQVFLEALAQHWKLELGQSA